MSASQAESCEFDPRRPLQQTSGLFSETDRPIQPTTLVRASSEIARANADEIVEAKMQPRETFRRRSLLARTDA